MDEIIFVENPAEAMLTDSYVEGHRDGESHKADFDFSFSENEIEQFMKEYQDMTLPELKEEISDGIDEMQEEFDRKRDDYQKKFDEVQEEIENEFDDIIDNVGEKVTLKELVPGSDALIIDDEDREEEVDECQLTYENDRHLPDFLRYVNSVYPSEIPKHDGNSMLGCEKAMSWLQRLSNEISNNVRNDVDGILEVDPLSKIQESILADVIVLKDHMKKLKQKLPEKVKMATKEEVLVKMAGTPNNMVICVSPFMRAITGILINSTVSGGKPFEDVYDYLIEKYQINEREQLEILQLLQDMGQPIFKDRGTMPAMSEAKESDLSEKEDELQGIDFITNYFA